jgi:hypothetical protein
MIGRLVGGLVAALAVVAGVRGQETGGPTSEAQAQAAQMADEWVKNNPPGRTSAQEHPVPKDNAQPTVRPEEREKLGLPAPTWVAMHGKVQPAVRAALEAQKRLMENPRSMAQFQGDRPAGFQGTAYADVYLRHAARGPVGSRENQAAIQEVQKRILAALTAAEFSQFFAFENTAGLVGYVDEAALAKLAAHPGVVAIGLDDQPRPEDPPRAMHGQPGVLPGPSERRGSVQAAVYNALEKAADGHVFVIVSVGPGANARTTDESELRDAVLSTLSAEEFRARTRRALLSGYVNAGGLDKLAGHPEVTAVGLDLFIPVPRDMKRHP